MGIVDYAGQCVFGVVNYYHYFYGTSGLLAARKRPERMFEFGLVVRWHYHANAQPGIGLFVKQRPETGFLEVWV